MLIDSALGFRIEMLKSRNFEKNFAQRKASIKMVAFHLLGNVTSPIWHSRPFVGVEQYWWSSAVGSRTSRPQDLVAACAHSQSSFPYRCRPMLLLAKQR